jgi:hypothetical protein
VSHAKADAGLGRLLVADRAVLYGRRRGRSAELRAVCRLGGPTGYERARPGRGDVGDLAHHENSIGGSVGQGRFESDSDHLLRAEHLAPSLVKKIKMVELPPLKSAAAQIRGPDGPASRLSRD